jgi:hypothetical protein
MCGTDARRPKGARESETMAGGRVLRYPPQMLERRR